MPTLTGSQKKHLRGLAHGLKPVVRIGRAGLSEGVLANLEEALESHELIKIKFSDHQDVKREMSAEIDARLGSTQVGAIGHVVILYRQARDPENRRLKLVGRPAEKPSRRPGFSGRPADEDGLGQKVEP